MPGQIGYRCSPEVRARMSAFEDEDAFERALDQAAHEAANEREEEFVAGLRDRFDEWGERTFLSEAQYSWLERIADGE